jgi:hypothetical protein
MAALHKYPPVGYNYLRPLKIFEMELKYPFKPKSNSKLKPGHFWPIRLSNGNFGCGIVLDIPNDKMERDTRSFYVGLLDWVGNTKPTANSLESTALTILDQGNAHIKTITIQEEEIIGFIDLEKNNLKIDLVVSNLVYSASSYVLKGFQIIRKSTFQDHEVLKNNSTWGYEVIIKMANRLLTK